MTQDDNDFRNDQPASVEAGWVNEDGTIRWANRAHREQNCTDALKVIAGTRATGDCTAWRITTESGEMWTITTSHRDVKKNHGDPITVALILAGLDW